jgi:hypothetical protein
MSSKNTKSKKVHAVIDRIEDEEWAVILLGDKEDISIDFPYALLPEGVSEGDHLSLIITIDKESRSAAENRITELMDRLEKKNDTKGKKDFNL